MTGVTPILFYDPVDRVIATLHPNHTYEKVVFDPWQQATWDVNDTVLQTDPGEDADVGDYFRHLPAADYLPTWYTQRKDDSMGKQEQTSAKKASIHANTPTLAYLDTLGRTFLSVAFNRFERDEVLFEEKLCTRSNLDIEGNQREVIDARERMVMRYDYDMLSKHIHEASMEAGQRWMLNDVAGKPVYAWDSRGHHFHTIYDALRRPIEVHLHSEDGSELQVDHTVYGETQANPEAQNLRGKAYQSFDCAGVLTSDEYDFKGNPLHSSRQLTIDYKSTPDWSTQVALDAHSYTSTTTYDALNRPVSLTSPDNSVIRPAYNEAKLLERLEGTLRGAADATTFISNIDYDAKGQRTLIEYGNGVQTQYEYDPETFRLTRLLTLRGAAFPGDCPHKSDCGVQNLSYTYDPIGNITFIRDEAQQTIYFRNRKVEASSEYTYDATYKLIAATGREHLGQAAGGHPAPVPTNPTDTPRVGLLQPGDGNAMGRYLQQYIYDEVGNILKMMHVGTHPTNPGWTRTYTYHEASQLEPGKTSNRLRRTHIGDEPPELYTYDIHGNMTGMPSLSLMQWDYRDQLQATAQQVDNNGGTPEITYYVYNSSGQRVRKVTERALVAQLAAAGQNPSCMKERIYMGGFEVYREYSGDGNTVMLERETLHVMDNNQRIALIETRTQGTDDSPAQLMRYQLSNHLGSATLELDDQGQIISYEEYYPYGSTSYQAVRNQTETPKRYRYTGKERDEETGLYYHGARYYTPWLGRWISCDPASIRDGPNVYIFVHNKPTLEVDPTGTDGQPWWRFTEAGFYYQTGKHDIFQPHPGVDTGFAPLNFVANLVVTANNLATIPFNAVTEAAAIPEEIARSLGASDQDVESLNFALMMTGVGEVAALPKLAQGATEVKNLAQGATEAKTVAQAVAQVTTEVKSLAQGATEAKNLAQTTTNVVGSTNKAANASRVALDTNAIIARLEGSSADVQAVVKAIGGRNTSVSITAVKEFLRGKGDINALRNFLIETGGSVGKAPSAGLIKQLTDLGLKAGDARVVGSAIEEGIPVLTRDAGILKKVPNVAEKF